MLLYVVQYYVVKDILEKNDWPQKNRSFKDRLLSFLSVVRVRAVLAEVVLPDNVLR